ncbi:hypothetical protein K502DRAFT_325910 [Neoconidiobolus thromboides FSU 785]|nr:hypothetical protein K502DRAFT_325910 [Neoconidiobolus thromboides FSU 785]
MDFCILATHTQHIVNVWFVFLTTCLAYNLQTVFLKKKVLRIANHWIYALGTLAICLVFYVPSIIYSYLTNNCYGLKAYKIAPWGFIYFHSVFVIPVTLCCCYCAYIFIKTYLTLRAKKIVYNNSNVQSNSVNLNNHMDLLARRLMSYAIIPLITQFPFVVISELYIDENYVGTVASDCFADVLSSSAGWLNFICFMFDPAIPHILYEYELRKSNGSIFQVTGNSSDNKPAINGARWLSSLKLGSDLKRSSTAPLTSITTTSSFTVIDSNDTRFTLSEVEETTAIRIKQM